MKSLSYFWYGLLTLVLSSLISAQAFWTEVGGAALLTAVKDELILVATAVFVMVFAVSVFVATGKGIINFVKGMIVRAIS